MSHWDCYFWPEQSGYSFFCPPAIPEFPPTPHYYSSSTQIHFYLFLSFSCISLIISCGLWNGSDTVMKNREGTQSVQDLLKPAFAAIIKDLRKKKLLHVCYDLMVDMSGNTELKRDSSFHWGSRRRTAEFSCASTTEKYLISSDLIAKYQLTH